MSGARDRRGFEIVTEAMETRSWCRVIVATSHPSCHHDRFIVRRICARRKQSTAPWRKCGNAATLRNG